LAFAALCAIAPAASADTIVVSPLDQPTLQAAISGATSGDVITFPPGGGTIALTSTVDVQKGVDIEGCPDPNSAGPCVTLQAASGFDALDVTTGGAAIHGLTITGAAVGIHVTGGSSTTIGGPAPGQATTISQSAGAAIQVDNPASGVTVDRVAGSGNGGPFISLVGGANGGAQTPAIVSASTADIIGLATPGALVRVYAAPGPGSIAGFAGTATADATGVWDLPDAAVAGETVAATATGSSGTSQLSASTATAFGSALVPIAAISGTGATVTTATPAFTLSSSDPSATLLCRVDSRLYAICPTVYQTASLTQGEHTLDLRAAGTGGLSSEVSDTFDVDLVPSATIRSGPPRYGRKSSGIFRFTVPSGTRSTRCAVDDARFKPCSGSFHTGYLLDGRHIFHLRTTDALGQATVLDTVFTIDTLAPRVSLATASLRIADTITAVTVTCPASEPGGCSGSVRIGTRPKKHSHKPFQEVGSATWQAGPTVVDTIPIQVPAWALAASQRGTGQPIWVVVVAQDDAGNAKQLRRKGKLLPPLAASGGGGVGV
jgi:hypothetical protein